MYTLIVQTSLYYYDLFTERPPYDLSTSSPQSLGLYPDDVHFLALQDQDPLCGSWHQPQHSSFWVKGII